eukprot:1155502-Pelagomonas_calceolata.AAC.5
MKTATPADPGPWTHTRAVVLNWEWLRHTPQAGFQAFGAAITASFSAASLSTHESASSRWRACYLAHACSESCSLQMLACCKSRMLWRICLNCCAQLCAAAGPVRMPPALGQLVWCAARLWISPPCAASTRYAAA